MKDIEILVRAKSPLGALLNSPAARQLAMRYMENLLALVPEGTEIGAELIVSDPLPPIRLNGVEPTLSPIMVTDYADAPAQEKVLEGVILPFQHFLRRK